MSVSLPVASAAQSGRAKTKRTCSQHVCIETVRYRRSVVFYGINRNPHLPITLRLRLELRNMKAGRNARRPHVLRGGVRKRLFRLRFAGSRWRYRFWSRWMPGDVTARHTDRHVYLLPFAAGERYLVSQSCNGTFSHVGRSRYAIDFAMREGTPVHAARSGKVVAVKSNSQRGGPKRSFAAAGNYIAIEHADRTVAYYYHLQFRGVRVRAGDRVSAGDHIGYSGNTGFSRGPHLHFAVQKPTGDLRTTLSIKVRFATDRGAIACPPALSRPRATYVY
ncbi:MAG: M23 family metallopeptidase [Pseudomonadota bacterium]